eukprot:TRINITY_DN33720_c0_g1_i1.p1 TRINITY_DN33720_c0_g1~~TRINITY_DN33720_c0_g1_i1.p1  ORF type:complete len:165 (+),score=41.25 TRINITY_DN33720_c0_g1_i1:35-529(+)
MIRSLVGSEMCIRDRDTLVCHQNWLLHPGPPSLSDCATVHMTCGGVLNRAFIGAGKILTELLQVMRSGTSATRGMLPGMDLYQDQDPQSSCAKKRKHPSKSNPPFQPVTRVYCGDLSNQGVDRAVVQKKLARLLQVPDGIKRMVVYELCSLLEAGGEVVIAPSS